MRQYLFLVSLVLPSSIFYNACDDTTNTGQKSCEYHTDCPIPERCIANGCRLECRVSTDCDVGAKCYEGVCYTRPDICRSEEACAPFQEVCHPRTLLCVPPGELSTEPAGNSTAGTTMTGTMAGSPIAGEQQAGTDTAGTNIAGNTDGGTETAGMMTAGTNVAGTMTGGIEAGTETAGSMAGGTMVNGSGAYGDDCNCPSDCASGFCVVNKMKRRRTCSNGCDQDIDCPGIDTCLQAQVSPASGLCPESPSNLPPPGSIVGVCAPNETAFPCEEPTGCTSGICLTPSQIVPWISPQSVCTMQCETDSKCPIGYRCGQVGGITETVCVEIPQVNPCPTGDPLSCGGVCPVPPNRNEADLAICLNGFGQQAGYCTCSCASANDCPNGFACTDIAGTGDPTRPKVCVPFAGGICPLSDQGVEQCLSTTCLVDEEDPTLNRCTALCDNNADCPTNYNCINVGDGSVCMPLTQ